MTMKKPIMDLGPVRQTKVHDYQRFFIALLLACAIGVFAAWGFAEGYLPRLTQQMGRAFTGIFTGILVSGLLLSLWHIWWLSRAINGLKEGGDARVRLAKIFQLENVPHDTELLKETIRDQLSWSVKLLSVMALVASGFGFLGTLIGIADVALNAFVGVEFTLEVIKPRMPMFWAGIQMAIQTSVVGFYVWTALTAMRLMLTWTAMAFKKRAFRMLAATS
jgi:hypothetical protein